MLKKAPGFIDNPLHKIVITPSNTTAKVSYEGHVIAMSSHLLILDEAGLSKVVYIPVKDIKMSLLAENQHKTYCPYKGHASYWSLMLEKKTIENLAWGYKSPFLECESLINHLAFYQNKVEIELIG
ncbi:hypothetical protein MED121_14924 [Marinomonas sp. MED121]|uniref:DUF427 domain-containing protein n=1 Tax=Marinomonas sp. MED121 TaxID=314277 RepID=UPI0000690F93|nr:DUF427 domain-containing protein [Marinomonas sp. MED121]EAQ67230.1 hypothetical protein MED121_14924 [Marinomonas sp. MED121]